MSDADIEKPRFGWRFDFNKEAREVVDRLNIQVPERMFIPLEVFPLPGDRFVFWGSEGEVLFEVLGKRYEVKEENTIMYVVLGLAPED